MKVLIVDNIEEHLAALESHLLGPGIEVIAVHSGNEALGVLLEEEVGLILLEVGMPQMNGLETAELIRGSIRTRQIPILFLAEPGSTWRFHFQGDEEGPVDYLFKPVDPDVLRSKVRFFQLFGNQKSSYNRLAIQLEDTLSELALLKGRLRQVESDLSRALEEAERFRKQTSYSISNENIATLAADSAVDEGVKALTGSDAGKAIDSEWKDDPSDGHPETVPAVENRGEEENPLHILLVEDNQINTRLVVGLIRQRKWTVDCAANGAEAVDMFRNHTYDLILMDIQMPEMDGMEATQMIREYESTNHLRRVPVIALSAHALKTDIDMALKSGMDDYLTKPFRPPDLYQKINRLVWQPKVSP